MKKINNDSSNNNNNEDGVIVVEQKKQIEDEKPADILILNSDCQNMKCEEENLKEIPEERKF
jgi:hypothetical protein